VLIFVSFPLGIFVGCRSAYKIYYFSLENCSAGTEFISRTEVSGGIFILNSFHSYIRILLFTVPEQQDYRFCFLSKKIFISVS